MTWPLQTPVTLVEGDGFSLPIQTYLRPAGSVAAKYAVGDSLSAAVYARGIPTPLFTPEAGWYTAPGPGGTPSQTGYDQGQVLVTGTTTQGALLQRGTSYVLSVEWTPAGNPTAGQTIAIIPIQVGTPY